jgi:hypothetical protein
VWRPLDGLSSPKLLTQKGAFRSSVGTMVAWKGSLSPGQGGAGLAAGTLPSELGQMNSSPSLQ